MTSKQTEIDYLEKVKSFFDSESDNFGSEIYSDKFDTMCLYYKFVIKDIVFDYVCYGDHEELYIYLRQEQLNQTFFTQNNYVFRNYKKYDLKNLIYYVIPPNDIFLLKF